MIKDQVMPVTYSHEAPKSVCFSIGAQALDCVLIPAGEFTMGSIHGLPLEQPPRRVVIDKAYLIGRYAVTRELWCAVMGDDPSRFNHARGLPVHGISWDHAQAFNARLGTLLKKTVRLPSEAQWEYACRAGSETQYYFGTDAADLTGYAWYDLNSLDRMQPVGLKRPNAWGLHDMVGNVWEWCEDVWHSDYIDAPVDALAWRVNEDQQPRRCLRGASWDNDAFRCRSAYRSYEWKELGTDRFGLRVVIEV